MGCGANLSNCADGGLLVMYGRRYGQWGHIIPCVTELVSFRIEISVAVI